MMSSKKLKMNLFWSEKVHLGIKVHLPPIAKSILSFIATETAVICSEFVINSTSFSFLVSK